MYLKRLELHGFKSFGRRVSVEFEPGLNAIVGPNGCGKSNLLDAIRWALGEVSARPLRGGRTEDIIFNGTHRARPLSMAEVVLTFDNTDGALPLPHREVAVARRAYRSGQTACTINGVPCRLRDVQELLAYAHFGARSFVLVSQGAADALSMGTGDERRMAVDEVAGIARYRHLALLARLSRERSGQEMERAQAILAETARHVAYLERQAERARRGRELVEAHRRFAGELARRDALGALSHLESARQALDQATALLEAVKGELEGQRRRMRELLQEHEELGQREAELGRAADEQRQALVERRHALERLSDREFDGAARLERAQQQQAALASEAAELAARIEEQQRELARLEATLAQTQRAQEELTRRAVQARGCVSEREQALEDQRGALVRALEELGAARNELAEVRRRRDARARDSERVRRAVEQLAARREELDRAIGQLDEEAATLAAAIDEQDRSGREVAAAHRAARSRLQEAEKALARAVAEHSQWIARAQALSRAHEEMVGLSRGVRSVMAARAPWRSEVAGPMAHLVTVPEGLEEAAAAALGSFVDAVVVRTAEAARRAVEYLRQQRAGWVSFIPLDFVRPRRLPDGLRTQAEAIPGALGLASELLGIVPELRPALEYALGRVLVVEDLEAAIEAGRRLPELARVVTRRGEVVVPGGTVSGGHREHTRGEVLAARRALDEASREAARSEQAKDAAEKELAAARQDLERVREQVDSTAEHRRELEARSGMVQGRRESLTSERARVEQEMDVLARERAREEEQAHSGEDLPEGELLARVQAGESRERELRDALARLAAEVDEVRRDRATLETELVECTRALEKRRADVQVLRSQVEHTRSALEERQRRLDEARDEAQAARQDMEAAHQAAAQLELEVKALQERLQALAGDQASAGGRRSAAQRELAELQQAIAHLERSVEAHSQTWMRADRQHAQAQERLDQALERLRREMGAGVSDPRSVLPASPELAQLARIAVERRRAELEAELERLGPVDYQVIDAYEEARRAYESASSGHADVLGALEALERWSARLDRIGSERLVRTVEAASARFDEMVRQLFDGGEGRLYLDGARPLDGRVQLEVRMPAKRMQPLVALSGGERAMVSAAFILALQLVRPSPVCVFDEIDASLDESNLQRLLDAVHRLAQDRQILFITHRQRTMEAAHSLFGVTMDEDGLSRLLVLKMGDVPKVLGARWEASSA